MEAHGYCKYYRTHCYKWKRRLKVCERYVPWPCYVRKGWGRPEPIKIIPIIPLVSTALIRRSDYKHTINLDGITRKITREGLTAYLKWKDMQGEPVYIYHFNKHTKTALWRYGLFTRGHIKRFSKSCYLFLGFKPKNKTEEWELLWSPEIWHTIKQKKCTYHPDKGTLRQTSFALVGHIEDQLINRKEFLTKWARGDKPAWIAI